MLAKRIPQYFSLRASFQTGMPLLSTCITLPLFRRITKRKPLNCASFANEFFRAVLRSRSNPIRNGHITARSIYPRRPSLLSGTSYSRRTFQPFSFNADSTASWKELEVSKADCRQIIHCVLKKHLRVRNKWIHQKHEIGTLTSEADLRPSEGLWDQVRIHNGTH